MHNAAGPELEAFAKSLGPIAPGKSVITPAFNLPSKYIIHAVCPRYIYGTTEEEQGLAMAYRSALSLKDKASDASSIAFVSLGTGVYGWPLDIASKIAVTELSKSKFETTMMCVSDKLAREVYQGSHDDFSNFRTSR